MRNSKVKAVTEVIQLVTALLIGLAAGIRLGREVREAGIGDAVPTAHEQLMKVIREAATKDKEETD